MKSSTWHAAFTLLALLFASASAQQNKEVSTVVYKGCYSSSGSLQNQGPYAFQTIPYCQNLTLAVNHKPVLALYKGSECWNGDSLPPSSALTDDANCASACAGFPAGLCGGVNYWAVYLSGRWDEQPMSMSIATASDGASPTSTSGPFTEMLAQSSTLASSSLPTGSPTPTTTMTTTDKAGKATVISTPTASTSPLSTPPQNTRDTSSLIAILVGTLILVAGVAGGWYLHRRSCQRPDVEKTAFAYRDSNPTASSFWGCRQASLALPPMLQRMLNARDTSSNGDEARSRPRSFVSSVRASQLGSPVATQNRSVQGDERQSNRDSGSQRSLESLYDRYGRISDHAVAQMSEADARKTLSWI